MKKFYLFIGFAFIFIAFKTISKLPEDVNKAYLSLPATIDYNEDVKPILSDKCFACHGPDKAKQKAGLRLDLAESAYAVLPESPGKFAIVPGNLIKSEMYHRILSSDPSYMMPDPKSHLSLSAKEKAILIKWIETGAVYKTHWAFVTPIKKPIPDIFNLQVNNPIDNYIFSRLQREGLQPNATASKELLLRRVSLDLTGLPPTIDEINNFVNDKSPNAYEKQVDRLISSPHYGEKMATQWLDIARYADSYGYTVDRTRDMSVYRDWVIRAFNENLSYKNFIHYQLAGDLMPSPTQDMIIATAFNRNHPQNMEGGIIEEEFQTEYVMDRTNTFGEAFLSISVGCARCHDHKYDPVSQENYYQLYGFFNNVREAGQISWNDDMPTPTLMLPTAAQEKTIQYINALVKEKEAQLKLSYENANEDFNAWLQEEKYKTILSEGVPTENLQGFYDFEDSLKNKVNNSKTAILRRDWDTKSERLEFEKNGNGQSLFLNGDTYLDLKEVGVFRKSDPFTIGLWINIPKEMKEGVIFHKSNAERLYNFKGYHVYLKNNKLEMTMAHTAPSNAISKISLTDVPRNQWIQITMTYDGSSTAKGLNLFIDGAPLKMETQIDQLYKDIIFFSKDEPGLQIGGWYRGFGVKGGKLDDVCVYNRELTPFEIKVLAKKSKWEIITKKKKSDLSNEDISVLKNYYFSVVNVNIKNAKSELQSKRKLFSDSTEYIKELMVMQEMQQPKKTFILNRGQYDAPTKQVFPNTPEKILAFPDHLPKNRYGLAQWLTDKRNPLTARVAVNHLWQNFFGKGLVKTAEDFGNQGEMPSHLDLLDWLAIEFSDNNWDIKKLNKLIVMSATYQQDSRASSELLEKDPENKLLARGPSIRLSAEMIRDNALMASGLLNKKIGGKSVYPYQPDGLWEINGTKYIQDSTDEVYRRSLYIILKRTVPNPTLANFDGPSRSSCVVRRQSTNTPLQALVTLNDPTFIEAAKVTGENITQQQNTQAAIHLAYRKLTGITPSLKQMALLTALQQSEYNKFKANPNKMKGWINTGLYKIDKTLDPYWVAANTVVASTILNSDAAITKR
ncbi:MAG: DUF1553 domain-containing protein [Sediminibacterium sp.]